MYHRYLVNDNIVITNKLGCWREILGPMSRDWPVFPGTNNSPNNCLCYFFVISSYHWGEYRARNAQFEGIWIYFKCMPNTFLKEALSSARRDELSFVASNLFVIVSLYCLEIFVSCKSHKNYNFVGVFVVSLSYICRGGPVNRKSPSTVLTAFNNTGHRTFICNYQYIFLFTVKPKVG